jgi:hypothetical protein
MLKHRKQALTELVAPTVEGRIKRELDTRITEAIEARKERLEEEIDKKRQEAKRAQEEYEKVLEERKKKIEEEIELEKKRHTAVFILSGDGQPQISKAITNQFESRLQKKSGVENRNPNNRNPFNNPITQPENANEPVSLNEIIIVGKE